MSRPRGKNMWPKCPKGMLGGREVNNSQKEQVAPSPQDKPLSPSPYCYPGRDIVRKYQWMERVERCKHSRDWH